MLPAGKFFRKIIAISPDLVYTGRCIGHPSLRRKQVSSPPVRPHPAASRRGGKIAFPASACRKGLFATLRHFSELQKALKNGDHHRAGHPSRVSRTHPSAPLTKGSRFGGSLRRGRQNCLPRLLFYGFQFCRYSFFQRRYHVGIFLFPGALSVWCLDDFLSFAKITEVMSAVRGTARMTPMLLAMPLMTSVAI